MGKALEKDGGYEATRGLYPAEAWGYTIFLEEYAMTSSLKIEGMSCEHCVKHVKEALEAISGVKSAKVKLKEKCAVVEHGEGLDLETLKAAVVEAGYEVA